MMTAEHHREYMREWRKRNPEYAHNYYMAHKDKYMEYHRRYRSRNAEKVKAQYKKYYQEHKEQYQKYYLDSKDRPKTERDSELEIDFSQPEQCRGINCLDCPFPSCILDEVGDENPG